MTNNFRHTQWILFVKQKKTHTLFLTDNIKMDRILIKIVYIMFQVLKVLLKNICKIQSLDLLFLVVFMSFYISRCHFSQVFRTSFNIIWKKDFRQGFFFFNGFTQTLTPRALFQPKSAKGNKRFLSELPSLSRFFKIIRLWWR